MFFNEIKVVENLTGDPDSTFKSHDYSGDLLFEEPPSKLCKKVDGTDAVIMKNMADLDDGGTAVGRTGWSGDDYMPYYNEAKVDVLAPESGYCATAIMYLDDPNSGGTISMMQSFVIGP